MILGVFTMTPNALKVSYKSFSSTSGSRLPTNKLAPTSRVFLSWLALFIRTGLPNSLTMFNTLMACKLMWRQSLCAFHACHTASCLPRVCHDVKYALKGHDLGNTCVKAFAQDLQLWRRTYSASSSPLNSTNACPLCLLVTRSFGTYTLAAHHATNQGW